MSDVAKMHYSVLLAETIDQLRIKPDGVYVDLTLGMGGHSAAILSRLTTGKLYAFDKDAFAIEKSKLRLQGISDRFELIHSDFEEIRIKLAQYGITKVDGIIADLGISSPQIDTPERGFSYNKDAKLDMRMNQTQEFSAYDVVNTYDEAKLTKLLNHNADVKLANKVAKAIVAARPISQTLELVEIIKSAYPAALLRAKNPAKAVFQALRIEVNNELNSLAHMLGQAVDLLNPGGSLCVITFHSIEDKMVKNFFAKFLQSTIPSKMPIMEQKCFSSKQIKPSHSEILENNRSRSAKLRVLTKLC